MQTELRISKPRALHFQSVKNPVMCGLDRKLICPQCGESLSRSDIEAFSSCPFCSFQFEPSAELEDFILEPEVDSWMKHQPGFTFQILNHLADRI